MLRDLCELLCAYRYGSMAIQHFHWEVSGATANQDHKMLGDVYQLLDGFVDGIGERVVGLGADAPDEAKQGALTAKWSGMNGIIDSMHKAYDLVCALTAKTNAAAAAATDEGTKDLLAGYADDLEQQVFFLRQRVM